MAVGNWHSCPRVAAGMLCSGRGGQGRNPKGCPRPCGGGSGFVHAWNGLQGAAVARQGGGGRGGRVGSCWRAFTLLVTCFRPAGYAPQAARKRSLHKYGPSRTFRVRSKPCFRFAQTACLHVLCMCMYLVFEFTSTGCGLSYTWLRHVSANPRPSIRRCASHGLAHPARGVPLDPGQCGAFASYCPRHTPRPRPQRGKVRLCRCWLWSFLGSACRVALQLLACSPSHPRPVPSSCPAA